MSTLAKLTVVPCPVCPKGQICPAEVCYAPEPMIVPANNGVGLALLVLALVLIALFALRRKP